MRKLELVWREILKKNIKRLETKQEAYIIEEEITDLKEYRSYVLFGLIEDLEEEVLSRILEEDSINEISLKEDTLEIFIITAEESYQKIITVTRIES